MEFERQKTESEGDLLLHFLGKKRKNAKFLSLHLIINYTKIFRVSLKLLQKLLFCGIMLNVKLCEIAKRRGVYE